MTVTVTCPLLGPERGANCQSPLKEEQEKNVEKVKFKMSHEQSINVSSVTQKDHTQQYLVFRPQ